MNTADQSTKKRRHRELSTGHRHKQDRRSTATATESVPRILVAVVDDVLRRSICSTLRQAGFCVSAPASVVAALDESASFLADVVIVDTELDTDGGRPVVDVFRSSTEQYVLCIAGENEHEVRVAALTDGADDAISQPIHTGELAARCSALLRRPRQIRSTIELVEARTLQFGPLEVDAGRHEIRIHGAPVAATRIEYSLLEQLCRRPTEVATRGELLDAVWGPSWGGDHHIVDVHLSNLRRKLDRHLDTKVIHTVRGVGFRLSDEMAAHLDAGDDDDTGDDTGGRRLSVA